VREEEAHPKNNPHNTPAPCIEMTIHVSPIEEVDEEDDQDVANKYEEDKQDVTDKDETNKTEETGAMVLTPTSDDGEIENLEAELAKHEKKEQNSERTTSSLPGSTRWC
jgi:hypothetical protein